MSKIQKNEHFHSIVGEDENGEWSIELAINSKNEHRDFFKHQLRVESESGDQDLFINLSRSELTVLRDMINGVLED